MPRNNDAILGNSHADAFKRHGGQGLGQRIDLRLRKIDVPQRIRAGTVCQVRQIPPLIDPCEIHRVLGGTIRDERPRHPIGDIGDPYFATQAKLRLDEGNLQRIGRESRPVVANVRNGIGFDDLFLLPVICVSDP